MPCSIELADAFQDEELSTLVVDGDWPAVAPPATAARPDQRKEGPACRRTQRLAKYRSLAISLAVLVGVAAASLAGREWLAARAASLAVKPADPLPATVRVTRVEPEVVAAGLHYSAAVKELARVELSFRVGGTVEALHRVEGPGGRWRPVHEGDRITNATALAWLDTSDYQRERALSAEKLAIAQARLAQLESDAELASIERRRVEQLVGRGAATDAELDTTRSRQLFTAAAVAGARRDVQSARIAVEQAEANLAYCTLSSPMEQGTIAARYLEAGERVAAGQPAFVILDLSSVVIAFGVPDTLVGRLSLGQQMEVTCDALPGERFQGLIQKIASAADPQTRTYTIEVRIDEPKGLRPGMIANVHLEREVSAYLLPLMAVTPCADNALCEVFRIVEEGGQMTVRRVPVEIEDVLDNRVAIRLGNGAALKPGDRVVATGTHRLHDGQMVSIEQ
ncbi:MAG TPA: efflux RND transporter periplasmic adaptor subunit [Pirellulales bacterium]|nr:efflux RND transporter periplasmic adaptor subunit [Pirellulales bacterium]